MTRFFALAGLLLMTAPATGLAQGAPAGLAYFSPARAFALSPEGKAAQTRLATVQAAKGAEVDSRRRSLQAQQDDLSRNSTILSESARTQRSQAIQRFEVDLERFIQDAQQELMGVQRELENAFLVKLRPALAGVAKARSLFLVVNEDAGLVAWADPSLDITPLVVAALAP